MRCLKIIRSTFLFSYSTELFNRKILEENEGRRCFSRWWAFFYFYFFQAHEVGTMGRYLEGPFPLGSVLCTFERPFEIQYNTIPKRVLVLLFLSLLKFDLQLTDLTLGPKCVTNFWNITASDAFISWPISRCWSIIFFNRPTRQTTFPLWAHL